MKRVCKCGLSVYLSHLSINQVSTIKEKVNMSQGQLAGEKRKQPDVPEFCEDDWDLAPCAPAHEYTYRPPDYPVQDTRFSYQSDDDNDGEWDYILRMIPTQFCDRFRPNTYKWSKRLEKSYESRHPTQETRELLESIDMKLKGYIASIEKLLSETQEKLRVYLKKHKVSLSSFNYVFDHGICRDESRMVGEEEGLRQGGIYIQGMEKSIAFANDCLKKVRSFEAELQLMILKHKL